MSSLNTKNNPFIAASNRISQEDANNNFQDSFINLLSSSFSNAIKNILSNGPAKNKSIKRNYENYKDFVDEEEEIRSQYEKLNKNEKIKEPFTARNKKKINTNLNSEYSDDFNKEEKNVDTTKNNPDDDETQIENSTFIPNKYHYIYEDNEGKKKIYCYQKAHGNIYDLRCKDRKCKGRSQFKINEDEIIITVECDKPYEEHDYCEEFIIRNKIKDNKITNDDLETYKVQKIYFEYMIDEYPNLSYNNIEYKLINDYNIKKVYYKMQELRNYKKKKNTIYNIKKENDFKIDSIELRGTKLYLGKIEFISNKTINNSVYVTKCIRLYGTKESCALLDNKFVTQYFVDNTYKCVPKTIENANSLLLLLGYNSNLDIFEICLAALMSHEDSEIMIEFYNHLKNIYNFSPKKITHDFALGNISALNTVFKSDLKIIPCFFHLVQTWWRKAIALGLRAKSYIKNTTILIFNLKILPFLNKTKAIKFYKDIKNFIGDMDDNFKAFYAYFEKYWLNEDINKETVYDFAMWSYYGKFDFKTSKKQLVDDSTLNENVFYSNNCVESLNHVINSHIMNPLRSSKNYPSKLLQ